MDLQYGCVCCLLKFKETKHTWVAKSGSSRNQYYLIASNGMSIFNAVILGDGRDCGGLRSLRSLRPLPQSTSSRYRVTRILRAPPPARVRGWTPLRNPFHPPGCILPVPLSHCHPSGRILPIVFSRLHSPIIILQVTSSYYLPPIPSSHLHPPIVIFLPHCHRNTLPLTISLWYSLTSTLFSHTC